MILDLEKIKKIEQKYRITDELGGIALGAFKNMVNIVMSDESNSPGTHSFAYLTAYSTLTRMDVLIETPEDHEKNKNLQQLNS